MMLSLLLCLAGAGAFLGVITNHAFVPASNSPSPGIEVVGKQLLSTTEGGYVLPFEVISILLLAAMVGAIAIAKGKKIKPKETE
jgi:NADH-quinone oxidoreductase subunit J